MKNSHAGAPATPFCVPGGHIVDPATEWSLVPCSFENEVWYFNPASPARLVCCTAHTPKEKS